MALSINTIALPNAALPAPVNRPAPVQTAQSSGPNTNPVYNGAPMPTRKVPTPLPKWPGPMYPYDPLPQPTPPPARKEIWAPGNPTVKGPAVQAPQQASPQASSSPPPVSPVANNVVQSRPAITVAAAAAHPAQSTSSDSQIETALIRQVSQYRRQQQLQQSAALEQALFDANTPQNKYQVNITG